MRAADVIGGLVIVGIAVFADPGEPGFGRAQIALTLAGVALALASLLPSHWNRKLLVTLGGTLVGVVLTEGMLQAFLRSQFTTQYELHPRYIYRYVPNSAKTHAIVTAGAEPTVAIRINSAGFRGPELGSTPAKRMVVYGDSNVAAEFSAIERTFVSQLAKKLAHGLGADVEGVNAGVVGYGPDQVSVKLEDDLPQLEPDLVVVVICGHNDFGDLLRNRMFGLDSRGELHARRFVVSGSIKATFDLAQHGPIVYRTLLKAWYRVNYASAPPAGADPAALRAARMAAWLAESREEYREAVIKGSDVVTNLLTDPYDADVSLQPNSESSLYKLQLMERVLVRLKRTTDRAKIPLLVVILPSPIDLDPRWKSRSTVMTDALVGMTARHGIASLNLYPAFEARSRAAVYFPDPDTHWNDTGQELAADLAARRIGDARLLSTSRELP